MLLACALIASIAASTAFGQTCTYEELVSNRYALSTTPVSGWGTVAAQEGLRVDGMGVVGGQPGAVIVDGSNNIMIHRPSHPGSRDASDPSMTDDMYWTMPSETLPVTGVPLQRPGDKIIPGLDGSASFGGISGALMQDLSAVDPSLQGPGLALLNCTLQASASSVECAETAVVSCGASSWGAVHDFAVTKMSDSSAVVFVATDAGLVRAEINGQNGTVCDWIISDPSVTSGWPVKAVTAAPPSSEGGSLRIVAGGAWRLWVVDASSGAVTHWEWATNFTSGQGGAVSDEVTSLAADWDTGAVYVGTLSALDVLYPNNTLGRVDGYGGLPFSRITSLAVQASGALQLCPTVTGGQGPLAPACPSAVAATSHRSTRLLIGSEAGLSIADVTPAGVSQLGPASKDTASLIAPLPVQSWSWRYMFLGRYLPGVLVSGVAAFGNDPALTWPGGIDAAPAAFVAASEPHDLPPSRTAPAAGLAEAGIETVEGEAGAFVDGWGLSWVERQPWTLELKARRMRNIQTRHNRHGLVAECNLSPAGNLSSCTSYPSDNNGLWTSLVSSAFFIEHALTGSAQSLQDATTFLDGLAQLNDVTGISGLMGRSCISPSEALPSSGTWYNSTAAGYEGWKWKGDTSSDEVAGQMFGFAMATQYLAQASHKLADSSWTPARSAGYLTNIAVYISKNNFKLIDANGSPTRWGDWSPQALNNNRSWTDERGVNALEILALLTSAIASAPALPDKGAASLPVLTAAWAELTNATNNYPGNLRNLKIETPCDDNYSDDELTALPFYTWMAVTKQLPGGDTASATDVDACLAGLDRWWGQMRDLRSDWWAAVTAGSAQARGDQGVVASFDRASAAADTRWNLETWPLEMIEWSVQNSHREDISFYQYEDRSGGMGHAATRVLPANERNQGRWNGDPHDLDSASGGMSEMDAGVFLLPYWKARLHGLAA